MNWKDIKEEVAKRDKYRCVVCGKQTYGSQIHHLVHRKNGGTNELSNLVTLCGKCHMLESDTPDFAVNKAFGIPTEDIPRLRGIIRKRLSSIKKKMDQERINLEQYF